MPNTVQVQGGPTEFVFPSCLSTRVPERLALVRSPVSSSACRYACGCVARFCGRRQSCIPTLNADARCVGISSQTCRSVPTRVALRAVLCNDSEHHCLQMIRSASPLGAVDIVIDDHLALMLSAAGCRSHRRYIEQPASAAPLSNRVRAAGRETLDLRTTYVGSSSQRLSRARRSFQALCDAIELYVSRRLPIQRGGKREIAGCSGP